MGKDRGELVGEDLGSIAGYLVELVICHASLGFFYRHITLFSLRGISF
jgi:hypothetical protein